MLLSAVYPSAGCNVSHMCFRQSLAAKAKNLAASLNWDLTLSCSVLRNCGTVFLLWL